LADVATVYDVVTNVSSAKEDQMPAPVQGTSKTITGTLTSVVRKQNANGKDFAEVVINGQECSAWDNKLIQNAECCVDGQVEARIFQKDGSKYWTLREVVPLQMPTPGGPVMSQSVQQHDPDLEVRKMALDAAIAALRDVKDGDNLMLKDSNNLVSYAMALELYLLALEPKPTSAEK
jgi:hypothetical protein